MPGARGCTPFFLEPSFDFLFNQEFGLPSPAGNNSLSLDLLFLEGHVLPGTLRVIAPGEETEGAWGDGLDGRRFRANNWATWFTYEVPAPGSVSGVVTAQKTGEPIAGATVSVSGLFTTTNAEGEYSFPVVMPGAYTVDVSAAGFASASAPATVGPSEDVAQDFALAEAPGAVSGRVTVGGSAIPLLSDVRVQLWQDDELKYEAAASSSLLAGSRGQYSVTNVVPGDYEVRIAGHVAACATFSANVTIPLGTVTFDPVC